jgi:ABC-type transport system involved in multi-copper enzyme maturation permease subunit
MTTETIAVQPPKKPTRTLREILTRNPVVLKELRGRMRGARAFALLTFHILAMSGFVTLLYTAYTASASTPYSGFDRQALGKVVFYGVAGIELLLVCFITPSFTVGAISGERERQTYDLLRTTLLSSRALVFGKLTSALAFVFLLLVAALPLQSLAFLLGGVAPEEIIIATVLLVMAAFLYGSAGILFSSLMRRTLGATVLTYSFVLLTTLGLPILALALLPVLGFIGYSNTPPLIIQAIMLYLLGLLVVTNPLATAVITEVILIDQHTAFYFTQSISDPTSGNSFQLPLVSPWLPFAVLAFLMSLLLIFASILAVRRAER